MNAEKNRLLSLLENEQEATKGPVTILVSTGEDSIIFRYAAAMSGVDVRVLARAGEQYENMVDLQSTVPEGMEYVMAGDENFSDGLRLLETVDQLRALIREVDRLHAPALAPREPCAEAGSRPLPPRRAR